MDTKKRTKEPLDLLTACEQIVTMAEDSRLSKEFFRKANTYIKYVSQTLDLTDTQSVLMALFLDKSDDDHIRLHEIAMHLDVKTIAMMRCLNDIDALVSKEYLRCSKTFKDNCYRVPREIIECFRKNERYVPRDLSGLTAQDLFIEVDELFKSKNEREISYESLKERVNSLLQQNRQLNIVQKVDRYYFNTEDKILLLLFCLLLWRDSDEDLGFRDYRFLFDDKRTLCEIRKQLSTGEHTLQKQSLIQFNSNDGFVEKDSMKLTLNAKHELLEELGLSMSSTAKRKDNLIHADKIQAKQLYYTDKTCLRVDELEKLLDRRHYQDIRERLKSSGFRSGFACLFYGRPGTGKTETVLQLARKTGRDIMRVDVSQVKSLWVGESEKNIKAVFEAYRRKVLESEVTPILLFNEADAIFGLRREGAKRSVDKMENSIQNIILQEMEELDGILIATTNLEKNLDKAFERRFLYKIQFESPTSVARKKIWLNNISELTDDEAQTLASKYDFSGGMIENVSRRFTIDGILYGKRKNAVERLAELCEQEKIEKKEHNKIGF